MSNERKGQGGIEKESEDGEEHGDGVGSKWRIGAPLILHRNEVEQGRKDEGKYGVHAPPVIVISDRHFGIRVYLEKEEEEEEEEEEQQRSEC
ncbi:hypothetical protein NL676_038056 [Syzygium grande]|nr:hypothetical protein NL676_038056 [Syzygium grande]